MSRYKHSRLTLVLCALRDFGSRKRYLAGCTEPVELDSTLLAAWSGSNALYELVKKWTKLKLLICDTKLEQCRVCTT